MLRRSLIAVAIVCAAIIPSPNAAQQRAADGVAINDDGLPQ